MFCWFLIRTSSFKRAVFFGLIGLRPQTETLFITVTIFHCRNLASPGWRTGCTAHRNTPDPLYSREI